jgi:hypothetical protein
MATFATATERIEAGEEELQDKYAVQDIDATAARSTSPFTAKRSTFGSPLRKSASKERQHNSGEELRPKTAIHDPEERNGSILNRPSVASFDSFESTGTQRSFPLINKPKSLLSLSLSSSTPNGAGEGASSQRNGTSLDGQSSGERLQPSPVHMLGKEDQILVERLVASLGKCVLSLQECNGRSYEGSPWRRRLDAARRILEGDEGAI